MFLCVCVFVWVDAFKYRTYSTHEIFVYESDVTNPEKTKNLYMKKK